VPQCDHARVRPLWADFLIAVLVFWAVLLPLEYGGGSAVTLAGVVACLALLLLLVARRRRKNPYYARNVTPAKPH
jgi:LPXTG-motif cell wall-anchored protein